MTDKIPFERYSNLALRTDMNHSDKRYYFAQLRLEASELENLHIKAQYHSQGINLHDVVKELGDVLWFVNALVNKYNLSLTEVYNYPHIEHIDMDFGHDTNTGLLVTLTNTLYNAYIDDSTTYLNEDAMRRTVVDYLKRILLTIEEIAKEHNIFLSLIMSENIKKLKKRYPEGYTDFDSLLRRDVIDE